MKEWKELFEQEEKKEYYQKLMQFLDEEYAHKTIYPPREDLFTCFEACSYQDVKVVMLGQDPYHRPQQAHGLCFSVRKEVKLPPSLKNMYKELKSDLDIDMPSHGYLIDWAKQGVFMMNAVLTVEEGKAGSHQKKGWEIFTDKVIDKMYAKRLKEEMQMTLVGQLLMEEGREEGREQGEERLSKLNLILIDEKRYIDLEKVSKDREYRKQLYAQYGI